MKKKTQAFQHRRNPKLQGRLVSSMAALIDKLKIWCLLASIVLPFTVASSDVPFILAHKKLTLARLKSGSESLTVTIDVYNQGPVAAYDVTFNDDKSLGDVDGLLGTVVSGNTSKIWERLDVGGSVSHSFEVECKSKGRLEGNRAVIMFRVPTNAAAKEVYSTWPPPLEVLADRIQEKKLELVKRVVGMYGSQISVVSIVGMFMYMMLTPSKSSPKPNKKKR